MAKGRGDIDRGRRNFESRVEQLVPLDRGSRFLAVARTREFYLDEKLVPRRIIDATTGEEHPLGDVSLIRTPGPEERYQSILASMPPTVAALAEHSLFNPAVSGDRRPVTIYPTKLAGAAHGKRCALIFGVAPGGWAYRLRIVDTETMTIVAEADLGRLHPFRDKGVISLALDGEGSTIAMARLFLGEGAASGKIVTSFLPELAAPAAFTVETPLPEDDNDPSLFFATSSFHLGWCEGRWLIARPWQGKSSLLVLDEKGRVVDEKGLSGPVSDLAASTTSSIVALGISPSGVEVVDLDTMTSCIYQPFKEGDPDDIVVNVAVASDGRWVAAHHLDVEFLALQPGRDRPIKLPHLEPVFEYLDESKDLCTMPAFGIGPRCLITVCGGAPTLHDIDLR